MLSEYWKSFITKAHKISDKYGNITNAVLHWLYTQCIILDKIHHKEYEERKKDKSEQWRYNCDQSTLL